MSLGDLVISLSANTARFDSDMGKSAQQMERWGNTVGNSVARAENACQKMFKNGSNSVDMLQRSFDRLNIKSGLHIETEASNIQAAFQRIKNSGVASMDEIRRAQIAMKQQLAGLDGGNMMKGHVEGMNGFSLASVAAIAKIQILYSLINQTMSAIGAIPGTAIDAIENYKGSIISNAAVITSMQGHVKDVGKAYGENKIYAEALEKVLIRMDTQTSASYEQLQLMNTAFISQGAILDINNAKAVEGYKSVAQAISVIAKMSNNPNQQFTQEAKSLFSGEMRAGNQLLNILAGIDPKIKEHLILWKQQGTVFENLNPLLKGYAAAQGDIDNMWQTIKSTMGTIVDEVLRGGLSGGFQEILDMMKEISKYAVDNKEKIQAFLKEGFENIKSVAKIIWEMRDGFKLMGEAAIFLAITSGISSVIEKLKLMDATFRAGAFFKALSNPLLAGAVIAAYGGYKAVSQVNTNNALQLEANTTNSIIKSTSGKMFGNGPSVDIKTMEAFKSAFPLDGPELLALAINKGAATLKSDNLAGGTGIYKLEMNLEKIKQLREGINNVVVPTGLTGKKSEDGATGKYSRGDDLLLANIIEYTKRLKEQEEGFLSLSKEIDATTEAEKNLFNIQNMQTGDLKIGDRYAATPLSNYRLMTNKQYSRPNLASSGDPDKEAENIERVKAFNSGMDSSIKTAKGDSYGASKDSLLEDQSNREKQIAKMLEKGVMTVEEANAAKLKSDELYAQAKKKLDLDTGKQAIASLGDSLSSIGNTLMQGNKEQFEAGKKAAIAGATVQMMLGAVNAYTSMTTIPLVGPALGALASAAVIAAGSVNIAQISSQQYEGREFGGPVTAGQTYVVGEKRPELFTPGASGMITPYVPESGGGGNSVTQVLQIGTGVADTVRSEIGRMLPALRQMAVQAVQQAQNGGQLQRG